MQMSVNTYNYTVATVCVREVWNNDRGIYAVEFIFIHLKWLQYLFEELEKEALCTPCQLVIKWASLCWISDF